MQPAVLSAALGFLIAVAPVAVLPDRAGDGGHAVAGEVFASPEAGGPRRLAVTAAEGLALHRAADAGSQVIATLPEGAILTSFGCASVADRVWCSVQPLGARTRGHVMAAALVPAQAPDGTVPTGLDDSAQRARAGHFDATGTVPCAQIRDEPLGPCRIGVARGTGGDATVAATFSNGFRRLLFFAHGRFVRGDPTMSGVGYDTDWQLEDGLHRIRVDDQRFELPERLVFGE